MWDTGFISIEGRVISYDSVVWIKNVFLLVAYKKNLHGKGGSFVIISAGMRYWENILSLLYLKNFRLSINLHNKPICLKFKKVIFMMLFRNRLEIWNPGHLPAGISIEQLYRVHESFPNNPLIANPLYLAGYAERLGTGTADIIKQCLAIGLKQPTFTQTDHFRITFWRNLETLDENLERLRPLQGLPKRMTRPALEKLILMLCSHEYLTVNQISTLVGKNSAYISNEIIPKLIDKEKLVRLFPATPKHKKQAYKTNHNTVIPRDKIN